MGNEVTAPESKETSEADQTTDAIAEYIRPDRAKSMGTRSTMQANTEIQPILAGIKAKINKYANRTGLFVHI